MQCQSFVNICTRVFHHRFIRSENIIIVCQVLFIKKRERKIMKGNMKNGFGVSIPTNFSRVEVIRTYNLRICG